MRREASILLLALLTCAFFGAQRSSGIHYELHGQIVLLTENGRKNLGGPGRLPELQSLPLGHKRSGTLDAVLNFLETQDEACCLVECGGQDRLSFGDLEVEIVDGQMVATGIKSVQLLGDRGFCVVYLDEAKAGPGSG